MESLVQNLPDGGLYSYLMNWTALIALPPVLFCGAVLLAGKRVPPLVATVWLLRPIAVGLTGELHGRFLLQSSMEQGSPLAPEAVAKGISSVLLLRVQVGMAALIPAALLILLASIAGAMRRPRRKSLAAAAVVMTVVLAALPFADLYISTQDPTVPVIRATIHLILGLLAAGAFLGCDVGKNGSHCAIAAGVGLATVVGVGELAAVTMPQVVFFDVIANHGLHRAADPVLERFANRIPLAWATIALGLTFPIVAWFHGRSGAGTLLVLLVPLLPVAWFLIEVPSFLPGIVRTSLLLP